MKNTNKTSRMNQARQSKELAFLETVKGLEKKNHTINVPITLSGENWLLTMRALRIHGISLEEFVSGILTHGDDFTEVTDGRSLNDWLKAS